MADQNPSSFVRTRIRRFIEIDNAYGEHFQFRSRAPFKSFDERLQESRFIFSGNVPPIGGYSRRHHSHEATIGVIDNIGWCYTVLHVNPFCPRVVREFISNKPFNEDGALIRGFWKDVVLKQAITHLTGGQCSGWTGFNLNALLNPFQVMYRVCERNWLPGPDSDLMMKKRLRLLYAVSKRKEIDFGQLVYEQVIDMARVTDLETGLIFPNLIYQLLVLQKEVPLLPGDEEPIGRGLPIYGSESGRSEGIGPRGRRRLC
ncbi:hypothetical protein F2Q69_00049657 [Brassica cretica]|uniref:Uncharacterized protein n=1 Tax=Brassica cretica TaxID=69181 RepID=A0A8S9PQN8_BRACR|nr:hypothetical protein F2Q69_00049657 [Brassica cretica]